MEEIVVEWLACCDLHLNQFPLAENLVKVVASPQLSPVLRAVMISRSTLLSGSFRISSRDFRRSPLVSHLLTVRLNEIQCFDIDEIGGWRRIPRQYVSHELDGLSITGDE